MSALQGVPRSTAAIVVGSLLALSACTGAPVLTAPAPAPARTTSTLSGACQGTSSAPLCTFAGTFTVSDTGAVDATATVSGYAGPMALIILGYLTEPATGGTCDAAFLAAPIPAGGVASPPVVTGHWGTVPAGTYCLNVAPSPMPDLIPLYSWTVTVTHP